jgi:hypothetical protein
LTSHVLIVIFRAVLL